MWYYNKLDRSSDNAGRSDRTRDLIPLGAAARTQLGLALVAREEAGARLPVLAGGGVAAHAVGGLVTAAVALGACHGSCCCCRVGDCNNVNGPNLFILYLAARALKLKIAFAIN